MSKGKGKTTVEVLTSVLEDFGTAQVLTSPSDLDREEAKAAVTGMPMDKIVRDLAMVAAQQVADVLQAMSLRPASYADIRDIPETVANLLKKHLSGEEGRDYFTKVFLDHLRSRG